MQPIHYITDTDLRYPTKLSDQLHTIFLISLPGRHLLSNRKLTKVSSPCSLCLCSQGQLSRCLCLPVARVSLTGGNRPFNSLRLPWSISCWTPHPLHLNLMLVLFPIPKYCSTRATKEKPDLERKIVFQRSFNPGLPNLAQEESPRLLVKI